jgi:P-type E1-E2 ATPase
MIELNIPGGQVFQLNHLVLDVNGTLAVDGKLIDGVSKAVSSLKDRLQIHLITADTHGKQHLIDEILNMQAVRLAPGQEAEQKAAFVRQLGRENVAAIGQGANDVLMLKEAALGISILSPEGLATSALIASDIVVADILTAFQLFEKPIRIVATLRK